MSRITCEKGKLFQRVGIGPNELEESHSRASGKAKGSGYGLVERHTHSLLVIPGSQCGSQQPR